jgi:hypothetical protein
MAALAVCDAHTHIFPPEVLAQPAAFMARDAWFAQLYSHPKAKLASAEMLIASMDRAGITTSWVMSFGWRDAGIGLMHNAYLRQVAAQFPGRLLPFAYVPLASASPDLDGFAGIGEWMPEGQGFDLDDHRALATALDAAHQRSMPVLMHASEPVGHLYPGKSNVSPASIWRLARAFPHNRFVAAHWGGGLPFYELMPEVRRDLHNVWYDTAAGSLLYGDDVFTAVVAAAGAAKILWASDYPLLSQRRSLSRVRAIDLTAVAVDAILAGNAERVVKRE